MVAQVERADPIAVLAVVADRVPPIELATGVIAVQSTLPQHLAQQARTVNQISGGRFTLGIGVCHQPIVTEVFGLEWSRPYSHMVQYLDALLPLLADQTADTSGDLVSHRTEIDVPGPAPGVLLAAMGPRMLALAGARTTGTLLAWTGPRTIAEHVRPAIGGGLVSAAVWVCVTGDPAEARGRLGEQLAGYRTPVVVSGHERARAGGRHDGPAGHRQRRRGPGRAGPLRGGVGRRDRCHPPGHAHRACGRLGHNRGGPGLGWAWCARRFYGSWPGARCPALLRERARHARPGASSGTGPAGCARFAARHRPRPASPAMSTRRPPPASSALGSPSTPVSGPRCRTARLPAPT